MLLNRSSSITQTLSCSRLHAFRWPSRCPDNEQDSRVGFSHALVSPKRGSVQHKRILSWHHSEIHSIMDSAVKPQFFKLAVLYQNDSKIFRSKMPHKRFSRSGWNVLVVFFTVLF